jgi:hypothetical protein
MSIQTLFSCRYSRIAEAALAADARALIAPERRHGYRGPRSTEKRVFGLKRPSRPRHQPIPRRSASENAADPSKLPRGCADLLTSAGGRTTAGGSDRHAAPLATVPDRWRRRHAALSCAGMVEIEVRHRHHGRQGGAGWRIGRARWVGTQQQTRRWRRSACECGTGGACQGRCGQSHHHHRHCHADWAGMGARQR